MHTVNVGPNLYFVSMKYGTYQACSVIRTTTLQVVYFAIDIAADKSLCDVEVVARILSSMWLRFSFYKRHIRLAISISAHIVKCRYQHYFNATFFQIVSHHIGAHQFALCQNLLFESCTIRFGCKVVQMHENVVEQVVCMFNIFLLAVQF